jgi:hypothetical protein
LAGCSAQEKKGERRFFPKLECLIVLGWFPHQGRAAAPSGNDSRFTGLKGMSYSDYSQFL